MLILNRIMISDLVLAFTFRYDPALLGHTIFALKVFCMRYLKFTHPCRHTCVLAHLTLKIWCVHALLHVICCGCEQMSAGVMHVDRFFDC